MYNHNDVPDIELNGLIFKRNGNEIIVEEE
jgi:hypothetical protein